jgi:hypothetical protein
MILEWLNAVLHVFVKSLEEIVVTTRHHIPSAWRQSSALALLNPTDFI